MEICFSAFVETVHVVYSRQEIGSGAGLVYRLMYESWVMLGVDKQTAGGN